MLDAQQQLDEAISQLYRTFAKYASQRTPALESDGTGMPRVLTTKQARSLSADELDPYTTRALTTMGTLQDFKYLLPRILELITSGEFSLLSDREISLSKLAYGKWLTWSDAEIDAVRRFLRCWWEWTLDGEAPVDDRTLWGRELETRLCCIAQAEPDLSRYLDGWRATSSLHRALHLATFIVAQSETVNLAHGNWRVRNAFWGDCKPQAELVIRWMLEPARSTDVEHFIQSCFDAGDVAAAELLMDASNGLELLRAGRTR